MTSVGEDPSSTDSPYPLGPPRPPMVLEGMILDLLHRLQEVEEKLDYVSDRVQEMHRWS